MKIDLFVDLNTEDETGFPWTYLDQATNPTQVVPGRVLVVGAGSAVALAEVIDVASDGLVHCPAAARAGQRTPLRRNISARIATTQRLNRSSGRALP